MISDLHGHSGPLPAMHCEILMTTGVEAVVDIRVTDADGRQRVPTTQEFYHIIKRLVKHQFTLTLNE